MSANPTSENRVAVTFHCVGGEAVRLVLPHSSAEEFLRKTNAGILVPVLCDHGGQVWFLEPDQAIAVDRESKRSRREAAVRDKQEKEREQALLGEDCPPLQQRLFFVLCDGHLFWTKAAHAEKLRYGQVTIYLRGLEPLHEEEVAEAVYEVDWGSLGGQEQRRYLTRLRGLQSELNKRLSIRRTPFRVKRPRPGWLFLWNTTDPEALALAREGPLEQQFSPEEWAELHRAREESLQQWKRRLRAWLSRAGGPVPHSGTGGLVPPTVEQCMSLIRDYLADGDKETKDLDSYCAGRGCRRATIRHARDRLGIKAYREGFGAGGRWLVQLPPAEQNPQRRPGARL